MTLDYNCLAFKRWILLLAFLSVNFCALSQTVPKDSAVAANDISLMDTTVDYDELFKDFDAFMDSILTPGSYFLAAISAGNNYYNFENKNNSAQANSLRKLTYAPTVGYYHKSGLGITATGYVIDDEKNLNLFQGSVSPSFDYLKNKKIATGISYTRFFTKDSLSFYTTPIQNELYAYFTFRKWWIRPSISASYGWGSRTSYEQREELLQVLRLRRRGFTYINTTESVSDFSLTASVRHDFYWLQVFTDKDHIRLTPQIAFTSGTQKFGFNQSSNSYTTVPLTGNNVLYNSDNIYLDDKIKFQPLALALYLRSEYSIGKFFVQPQFALNYYFPASSENISTQFSVNAGFIF